METLYFLAIPLPAMGWQQGALWHLLPTRNNYITKVARDEIITRNIVSSNWVGGGGEADTAEEESRLPRQSYHQGGKYTYISQRTARRGYDLLS
jgi:hypothetical protein